MENNEVRFQFGENWRRFLELVDESRIQEAEKSLQKLLGLSSLNGQSFLDIGSGSGLFSLAVLRLGARVHSFDYDPQSVACARALQKRFAADTTTWTIEQGSALDSAYLHTLGTYDIVYSWGVLHHTGAMWKAVENAMECVKPGGILAIALYNDQGVRSRGWLMAKQIYNALPESARPVFAGAFMPALWGPATIKDFFKGKPFQTWKTYASRRGMSPWRDVVDWVGGLPFEVSSRKQVTDFCQKHGFELVKLVPESGFGCNEFVFRRLPSGKI